MIVETSKVLQSELVAMVTVYGGAVGQWKVVGGTNGGVVELDMIDGEVVVEENGGGR